MRIAFVTNELDRTSGSQLNLKRLCRELGKKHEIEILAEASPRNAESSGIGIINPYLSVVDFLTKLEHASRSNDVIIFYKIPYDIYHGSTTERTAFSTSLCNLSKPKILRINNSPQLAHISGWFANPSQLTHLFAAFIAQSESLRKEISEVVDPYKVFTVPNGVPTNFFVPVDYAQKRKVREHLGLPLDSTVYAFVGRYIETKRLTDLITAWKKWFAQTRADAHLLLVGYNPDSPLENHSNASANIHDIGKTTELMTRTVLQASDFFIFPSVLEGLSNAVLEAISSGLIPIVNPEVSGMERLGSDLAIHIPGSERLCDGIHTSLGMSSVLSPEERRTRALRARLVAETYYSLESQAELISEISWVMCHS